MILNINVVWGTNLMRKKWIIYFLAQLNITAIEIQERKNHIYF